MDVDYWKIQKKQIIKAKNLAQKVILKCFQTKIHDFVICIMFVFQSFIK